MLNRPLWSLAYRALLVAALIAALLAMHGSAHPVPAQQHVAAGKPTHSLQWVCDHIHAGPVTVIHARQPRYDYEQGTCGVWDVATFATVQNRDGWARAVRAAFGPTTGTVLVGSDWGASSY